MNGRARPLRTATGRREHARSGASVTAVPAAHAPLAAAGNQQALRALGIRPKLAVSQPGDADELEADRAADEFMSGARIHRACAGCGADGDTIMRTPDAPSRASPASRAREALATVARGGGQPLALPLRRDLEQFFDADLRGVRVHDDAAAAGAARAIAARAFAHGNDIAFASGELRPQVPSGRRLVAHEVAHVVQQRRVPRPAVHRDADEPQRGVVSGEEMAELMRKLSDAPTASRFSSHRALLEAHGMAVGDDYIPLGWQAPGLPDGTLQRARERDSFKCPTSACHSVATAFAREGEQRARDVARHQRWEELHPAQYEAALDQQPKTLAEDIDITELSAASSRAKLFDLALAARTAGPQSVAAPAGFVAPRAAVTEQMRDTWAIAQQATTMLSPYLRGADTVPQVLADNARPAYEAYYRALADAVRAKDRADRADLAALVQFEGMFRGASEQRAASCPGPCHGLQSPVTPRSTAPLSTAASQRTLAALYGEPSAGLKSALMPGEREQRLLGILSSLAKASTTADWKGAVGDFRWATDFMDELLKAQVPNDAAGKKAKDELKFATDLLLRERQLEREHPEAKKIQAIFYPKDEGVWEPAGPDGMVCQMAAAKGIPWQFYLTHTPVASGTQVPTGFQWELHDLTAPRRTDGRSVKTDVQLDTLGALELELRLQRSGGDLRTMDPYPALFAKLDDADFFPEGEMYWRSPSGALNHMTMHAEPSFWDWLKNIGMAIAILGSLIFAPLSVPMLVSFGVGTALATIGKVGRLLEKEEHGVLQAGEWRGFFWDLALDVVSALTLGFGRLARVALEAEQLLRAASLQRTYFLLEKVSFAADVVNVGLVVDGVRDQYLAIMKSDMTPAQKRQALEQLTTSAFASGLLSLVPVYLGARNLRRNGNMHLDVDPANRDRLVANFDTGAEFAGHAAPTAVKGKAPNEIGRQTGYLPNGEMHQYSMLSDGRVIRCSDGCDNIANSVGGRLADLELRMLDATHTTEAQALRSRVNQLKAEGEIAAADSASLLKRREGPILREAKAIDSDLAQLESKVAQANEKTAQTGRELAESLHGPSALDFDRQRYYWRRNKDGTLEFRRRSRYVPDMQYNAATRKFEVTRPLFDTADAATLARIRESSATRDLPILATVDNLAALDRIRPRTPYKQAAPRDYVLVKVNEHNAFELLDQPLRLGEIREFPDGSRAWRTPQNTIMTEGLVRQSTVGRRGFEQEYHTELKTIDGISNEGVPLKAITGTEHQRSHVRGQITGFEFSQIPYAPTYVNQQLQAQGIELFTSSLRKTHSDKEFMLRTEHKLVPDTLRMAWMDYHIALVEGGKQRDLVTVRIGTDYSDPARPANYEIRAISSRESDQALLLAVDMPAARAELDRIIKEARARRAASPRGRGR